MLNQGYRLKRGDPVVCETSESTNRYLCGIASFGRSNRSDSVPGVHTDVSKYHGWITNYMQAIWDQYQSKSPCSCLINSLFYFKFFGHARETVFTSVNIMGGKIERREDCGQGKFRCPNNGICIPEEFTCDGEYDCDPLMDWDERNCTFRPEVLGPIINE